MKYPLWLLAFASLARAQDTNEALRLAPPYAELPPTFWEQYGGFVIFGGIVVLAILTLIVWVILKPKPLVTVPLEVQMRRALEALQTRPEDGALLSEVSQILRRYYALIFQFPPGEQVTAEFVRNLASHEEIGEDLAERVAQLLSECDERKFAKGSSGPPLRAGARALELIALAEARQKFLRVRAATDSPQTVTS